VRDSPCLGLWFKMFFKSLSGSLSPSQEVFSWGWTFCGESLPTRACSIMDVEVSALMGVANEAIWRREGLFTSSDALGIKLCINTTQGSEKTLQLPPSVVKHRKPPAFQPFTGADTRASFLSQSVIPSTVQGRRRVLQGGRREV
jgi:hypothetical protein